MDKEDAEAIINLLREIKSLGEHQAQYLQEIRDTVAADPLKSQNSAALSPQEKSKGPNANLFTDARKKSGMDPDRL